VKYYLVGELNLTDRRWVAEYVKNVTKLVEERGGRYLARTATFRKMEGERETPQIFLLIEWPSKEAAEAFYESEEYRPYRESRKEGSRNEMVLIAGEDINKIARIADE